MFFLRLIASMEQAGLDYALVGGYAVALHGALRGTVDIDLVINLNRKDFLTAERILKSLGLQSKLPVGAQEVFDYREEYIKNRNLVAWSFYNPMDPLEMVDIVITHDLKKLKKELIHFQGFKIKVLSKDDLIQMKSGTGRKQDIEDVKALKYLKAKK